MLEPFDGIGIVKNRQRLFNIEKNRLAMSTRITAFHVVRSGLAHFDPRKPDRFSCLLDCASNTKMSCEFPSPSSIPCTYGACLRGGLLESSQLVVATLDEHGSWHYDIR